jgi:hypothetical protein
MTMSTAQARERWLLATRACRLDRSPVGESSAFGPAGIAPASGSVRVNVERRLKDAYRGRIGPRAPFGAPIGSTQGLFSDWIARSTGHSAVTSPVT